MAKQAARLRLSPDLCNRCGRCIDACDANAIKVGPSYIYVDWRKCEGCYACADACDRGAIERRDAPRQAAPAKRRRKDSSVLSKKASTAKKKSAPSAAAGESEEWSLIEAVAILAGVFAAFVLICLGSPAILRCPSDKEKDFFASEGSSYDYNTWLGGREMADSFLTQHLGASRTPVMYDYEPFHGTPGESGAANYLFADGHVGDLN